MYHVNVRTAELSIARVASRVEEGGHNVPEEKIRARYKRNQSLIKQAALKADIGFVYDNSGLNQVPVLGLVLRHGRVMSVADDLPEWVESLYLR